MQAAAALPQGLLATGGVDRTVRVWRAGRGGGKLLQTLNRSGDWHSDSVAALAVVDSAEPGGGGLQLLSGSTDGSICRWDPHSGQDRPARPPLAGGHGGDGGDGGLAAGVRALSALPADQVASGGTDGSVTLWQVGPASSWFGVQGELSGVGAGRVGLDGSQRHGGRS